MRLAHKGSLVSNGPQRTKQSRGFPFNLTSLSSSVPLSPSPSHRHQQPSQWVEHLCGSRAIHSGGKHSGGVVSAVGCGQCSGCG